VPVGTYTVTASKDGYQSVSKTDITVDAGETTTENFDLTPVQPPDIIPYIGIAVVIIIIIGIAVYMLKIRKPT